MKIGVVGAIVLVGLLLSGCNIGGQARSIQLEIDQTRERIAAQTDEKHRLEGELRRLDNLVRDHQKARADYDALQRDRDALIRQIHAVRAVKAGHFPTPSSSSSPEQGVSGSGAPRS